MKKWIATVLITALTLGALTGCGSTKDSDPAQKTSEGESPLQTERGAYVETEISLPEEWANKKVAQVFTADDTLHLLLVGEDAGNAVFQEWEYNGEFAEVTEEWLRTPEIPYSEGLDVSLLRDGAGNAYLYACYLDEAGENYKGHLWKAEEDTLTDITPEKWTKPDEVYGFYQIVRSMAALDNGTLAALYYSSVDILSGEDGSVQKSISPVADYYGEEIVAHGDRLYLLTTNDAGYTNGVEAHLADQEPAVIPFSQKSGSYVHLSALSDGKLIVVCGDGIFRYQDGADEWEKLMEGMDTSFGLTTTWCRGMTALENGEIYALFGRDEGGMALYHYAYDPDAVRQMTEVLTLYTVDESYLLQQAAILYHKEHPEVRIEIDSAYSLSERYTPHDYDAVYQELNTSLMGEYTPDLIVLDHLNMESFAEKGVLVDISDIVKPMEESGELLSNITGAYERADGARYAVPLQFGITMAVGRDIAAEDMGSLEALAAFLSKKDENYLGEQTVWELVDKFYPSFCGELVENGQLNKKVLSENLEYLKTIADSCGVVEKHGERGGYGMWDLPSRVKLAFDDAEGFKGSMQAISMAENIEGEFTAFEKTFKPSIQIGVCARSGHAETALDFLRFALSQEVQDIDYRSGFPVNAHSLQVQAGQDRSDSEVYASIVIEEGVYEDFHITDYSEELAKRLLALCQRLERPTVEDEKIKNALIEALPAYFNGSRTLEETVNNIEAGLRMYLAE
ncbi:MAG: extracellular solute-binding protein [Acetatifactor sp.]|nr:extracellular solute-binding protein [Acetatifactor sp.]